MTEDKDTTEGLERRARQLEYGTIAWNVGEAGLTIGLGIAAGSLALIGFGTDSLVEIFASVVVLWHIGSGGVHHHIGREQRALRLVAAAFLVLAIALLVAGVTDLASGRHAEASPIGIAYLAVTALVMFWLARAKRTTAHALNSRPLHSEASMTFLDGVLATLTLLGLTANAALDWWWADPAAALIVAAAALNEARENWSEAAELTELEVAD